MTDTDHQPPSEDECRELRRRSRDDWDSVAEAWEKWEPHFAAGGWPVTQKLIAGLRMGPQVRVLDVGCGVGNPSLQIAAQIAPHGSVLGSDLSEGMVAAARRKAERLELTNATFRVGAAEELAEPPGNFDAVVSRFTIMFMPDVLGALRHLRRLLRQGGRIAVSVWTPHRHNPMFAIPRRALAEVVDLPQADPYAPGPMRLSGEGELATVLTESGFSDVRVEKVPLYQFARDPADYWSVLTQLTPMLRRHLASLTDAQRHAVRAGVMEAVARYASGSVIRVPALAQVGTASA
ncbi:MAG: class I SAM-dependent methyltransferase [Planctomycetota bacterium]|jgi:ubiquinone/menaquinone biosynthesis C-methylase UbiE